MTYCFQCGHVTSGKPFFCNACGRSYDIKLCLRLHVNPRSAEACSRCGSRELSTPQPKVSFSWHILAYLVRVVLGSLLVWFSIVVVVAVLQELFQKPVVQEGMVVLGMLFVALWFLWAMLPHWFRKMIRRSIRRKQRNHER
jgi:hypothetical protein